MLISPAELNESLQRADKVTILDIREPYEYACANLGSLHIPMGEIVDRINEVPTDGVVVVMCRSGKRAEAVANLLTAEFDRTNVSILEGGILAWKDCIDPSLDLE